jgi:hypothetical protein
LHISLAIELSLLLALLSHWLGLRSLEQGGWRRVGTTSASTLLIAGYLLLYELPLGLELIRPALMAIRLRRLERFSARSLFRAWAPWLAVFLAFVAWRVFVFRLSDDYERRQYNVIVVPGAGALVDLGLAGWKQLLATWVYHLQGDLPAQASTWLLAGLCVLAGAFCMLRFRDGVHPPRHIVLEMAAVGLAILVAGQVGPLLTGSVAEYRGLYSRWTHSSVLGASLLWTALLLAGARVVRRPRAGQPILAVMIGLGALWHVENARDFIQDWERQRQLFWQLAWRAPAFEPGLFLVFDRAYKNAQDRRVPDYVDAISAELFFGGGRTILAAEARRARIMNSRQVELWGLGWKADPARTLLVHAGQGCIEVVSGRRLPTGKRVSRDARSFLSASSALQIRSEASPASPFRFLFGPEPPRGWCYFYQRARLAEQLGRGEDIVRLGEEAWALGLRPQVPSEWAVFRRAFRRVMGREFPPESR